jgi:ribonuclease D
LKVAEATPKTLDELIRLGISERQLHRFGKSMLEAVERGHRLPLVQATELERVSDAVLNRLNRLKSWRKVKAEALGVESDVILPRYYMSALAEKNPRGPEALSKILEESPWRLEHFGPEILNALGVKQNLPEVQAESTAG